MKKIVHGFVRNAVLANLIMLMVLSAGALSLFMMIREILPSFEIESISVVVPYPGASPEEVEEGIALKIEDALESVQGIRRITTSSAEGMATAIVQVQTGNSVQRVKDRVTDRINAIQTFPEDAERPIVSEFQIRRQTIFLALSGEIPERQLKELAEQIKDELILLPNVSDVEVHGTRPYEISIEISEQSLRRYGLTFQQVTDIVRGSSMNLPGGRIRSDAEELNIRTMGRNYTGNEFGEIVLVAAADGTVIRLRDIATIRDGFVEDQAVTRFNGKPAASIVVFNSDDEDGLLISGDVHAYIARKNAEFQAMGVDSQISLDAWLDSSVFITERIDLLLRNGIAGLLLVFLLLYLFLDLRLSFWVTLGIPISLSGGLFLMYLVGSTINMISLFAMILVLGIIVDDAIVVGESIYVHRRMGKSPIQAAVDGTAEVAMPVMAAVITSCIAFAPLLFVTGIMGKFIMVIPTVVICALLVSLIEAFIILPAHLNNLPEMQKKPSRRNPLRRAADKLHGFFNGGMERFIENRYKPMMVNIISYRYSAVAALLGILIFSFGLVGARLVSFEFFPSLDTSYLIATVEFPEGTPIETTEDAMIRLEDAIREVEKEMPTTSGKPMIVGMQTMIGQLMSEATGEMEASGGHKGQMLVELLDAEERGLYYRDIVQRWQEKTGAIAGTISVRIEGSSGGPPGKPIEIWLLGRELEPMRAAAAEIRDHLATYAGVFQIQDDFRPGKRELRAELLPEARTLGLTTGELARQIRAGFYGEEALRVQRGRDEIRVWVRYPEAERQSVGDLESVRIRPPDGTEVPLLSVARVEMAEGYTTITRIGGLRRISVTADVFADVTNAGEVLGTLQRDFLPELEERYPGIEFAFEGDAAEQRESFGSLQLTFPLAIIGIYLIIASLFRSYVQPLLILVTVPFGVIGAIWGHVVFGYALTMMSMFGIVALAGIVVNNAIVFVEAVNQRIAAGYEFATAIIEGGARRFRAIFLTTATTVGGLTPMMLERSFQAQFLIPMAVTIAAGVAFATLLTLVILPCLLYILNDFRIAWFRFSHGYWPTRTQVEPATRRDLTDEDFFAEDPVHAHHVPHDDPFPAG